MNREESVLATDKRDKSKRFFAIFYVYKHNLVFDLLAIRNSLFNVCYEVFTTTIFEQTGDILFDSRLANDETTNLGFACVVEKAGTRQIIEKSEKEVEGERERASIFCAFN